MKLILLRCPVCSVPLTPENDDVVVACTNCHNPIAIAVDGPVKMNVRFALPAGFREDVDRWVPFWVYEGLVKIQKRDTQGGSRSAKKDAEALWGGPRRLYVPAWDLSIETAQRVGSRLIQQQPQYQIITKPEEVQLVPAVVTPSDARKVLDFIIVAIEARRKDWLKDLAFELDVGQPEMWALPQAIL